MKHYRPTKDTTIQTSRGIATLCYGEYGTTTASGKPQVKGFCVKDSDGNIGICVNSSYPQEIQDLVLKHELYHIDMGHLDEGCMLTIDECEDEVDEALGISFKEQ